MPDKKWDDFKASGTDAQIDFGKSNFNQTLVEEENSGESKETKSEDQTEEVKEETQVETETQVEETKDTEVKTEETQSEETQDTEKELLGIQESEVDPKERPFYKKAEDGSFVFDKDLAVGRAREAERRMHEVNQESSRVQRELNQKLLDAVNRQQEASKPSEEDEIKQLAEQVQAKIDSGEMTQAEAIIRTYTHMKNEVRKEAEDHRTSANQSTRAEEVKRIGRENYNYLKGVDETFDPNYQNFTVWIKDFYGSSFTPQFQEKMVTDRKLFTNLWKQYKSNTNPQELIQKGIETGHAAAKKKIAQSPTKSRVGKAVIEKEKGDSFMDELFAVSGYQSRVARNSGK